MLRGRDRAAAGLALGATAFLTAIAISFVPSDGLWPVLAMWSFYLLARVGFYVMAESMVTGSLHPRARTWWRAGFLVLLAVAAIRALIGPIVFVTTGRAEMLRPAYGLIVSATYLPPVMLLFVSYQGAEMAQRLRLRWMLASSTPFGRLARPKIPTNEHWPPNAMLEKPEHKSLISLAERE